MLQPRSGAAILVQSLLRHGVRTVFAYPGGTSMPIHQALTQVEDRLRTILPRHEQGGGFAASAYARFTGQVGICIATSGPGATNFVPCMADAMRHGVPMLVITGQVHRPAIGTDAFQEIPIVAMCRWITKHHYQVGRTEDMTRVFREAFHLATTGRPGPVLIDVPKDVQIQQAVPDFEVAMNLGAYRAELTPVARWCPELAATPQRLANLATDEVPSPRLVLGHLWSVLRQQGQLDRAVLTTGCGPEQAWLARSFRFPDPDQWLTTDSMGAEGYALPAALGVLAADPARPVIAVVTPDNLLVNIHELASAFCEKLPVKLLVLNTGQHAGLDYVQLCRGFRGQGSHVARASQLDDGMKEMLAATGPYLLDVEVNTARVNRESERGLLAAT